MIAPRGTGDVTDREHATSCLAASAREIAADSGGDDAALFRQVLACFGTGVTVITSKIAEEVRGMTASAFMSGSLNPPLVVASIGRHTRMHDFLAAGHFMGISILSSEQEVCSRRFAGQLGADAAPPPLEYLDGIPVISGALAVLTTHVCAHYACGDHTLFVGRVRHLAYSDAHQPLLHYRGRYARLHVQPSQGPPARLEPEEWTVGW